MKLVIEKEKRKIAMKLTWSECLKAMKNCYIIIRIIQKSLRYNNNKLMNDIMTGEAFIIYIELEVTMEP